RLRPGRVRPAAGYAEDVQPLPRPDRRPVARRGTLPAPRPEARDLAPRRRAGARPRPLPPPGSPSGRPAGVGPLKPGLADRMGRERLPSKSWILERFSLIFSRRALRFDSWSLPRPLFNVGQHLFAPDLVERFVEHLGVEFQGFVLAAQSVEKPLGGHGVGHGV